MFQYNKRTKRRREVHPQKDREDMIAAIRKIHKAVHPLPQGVEEILVRAMKRLNKEKDIEYAAYRICTDLMLESKKDPTIGSISAYPKEIQELYALCYDIGQYFFEGLC